MKIAIGIALAFSLACDGKSDKSAGSETEPPAKDESGKPADAAPADKPADSPDAAPATAATKPEFCTDACRLLATESLDDAMAKVDAECGESLDGDGTDCDQLDYLRNCIYAANGYMFKKKKWQDAFANKDWYEPDKSFKDSKIPKVGLANVAALKDRAADCRAGAKGISKKILAQGQVDFGDGKKVRLRVDKSVVEVGGTVISHKHKIREDDTVSIKTIDIDTNDDNKEALIRVEEYEDLAYHIVVSRAGGTPRASRPIFTSNLEVKGNGKVVASDANCGETTTAIYKLTEGVLKRTSKKKTGKYDESLCAACPFVYVETRGVWQLRGEILREVRFAESETTRRMPLGRAAGRKMRIQIRESKSEITHLERVALWADGIRIEPTACPGAAFCAIDNRYHTLVEGDALTLEFEVPPGAELTLTATGYYVPLAH